MYPPVRIDGFCVWYDTYGNLLHIKEICVPPLRKLMEFICSEPRSEEEYDKLFERHKQMWLSLSSKAVTKYWLGVVCARSR